MLSFFLHGRMFHGWSICLSRVWILLFYVQDIMLVAMWCPSWIGSRPGLTLTFYYANGCVLIFVFQWLLQPWFWSGNIILDLKLIFGLPHEYTTFLLLCKVVIGLVNFIFRLSSLYDWGDRVLVWHDPRTRLCEDAFLFLQYCRYVVLTLFCFCSYLWKSGSGVV